MTDSPPGWASAPLAEICTINPRVDKNSIDTQSAVSFVPMPAVEAETGQIDVSETRSFGAVRKGYTPFRKGDVLFAKITPCMENGKMAVVPDLVSEYGFGSTEFHVLRPADGVDPRFVYHAVSNRAFRFHAEHNMTGAVGQKRVPATILEVHEIGLPPTNEQRRIADRIETLFDEIHRGVESLRTANRTIDLYRQSLLKSAFEGRLTAQWRAKSPDKLESPNVILARLREGRESCYRAALEQWELALDRWQAKGGKGVKPAKPTKPTNALPLDDREMKKLPPVPDDWGFNRLGLYIGWIQAGKSFKCLESEPAMDQVGVAKVSAVTWGEYDEAESKTCLDENKIDAELFVREGDFLLSRANTIELVGAAVIVKRITKKIMLSDKTLRIHFAARDRRFFLHYLRSPCGRAEIQARSTGNQASMRNIGQDRINSIILPICSPAEQSEIVRILEEHLEAIDTLEAEIDTNIARADALRQSILTRAFSGELVPQDPSDEPAHALLARIRASRQGDATAKLRRSSRRRARASTPP